MSLLKSVITKSLLATTALVFATSNALAGTDTDPQSITATVAGACTVTVPDVDFGAITNTGKVIIVFITEISCSVTPLISTGTLEANAGAHFFAGTRNIEGAVGSPKPLMAYELHVGNSDAGPVMGDTGSGGAATHPASSLSVALSEVSPTSTIFAAVLAASGGPRPEGVFADTVTWTLTF